MKAIKVGILTGFQAAGPLRVWSKMVKGANMGDQTYVFFFSSSLVCPFLVSLNQREREPPPKQQQEEQTLERVRHALG